MSNEPMMEATSDDKLWAALTYIFSPLIPIILMLMEDKKNRPFIRAHNAQALVLGLISVAVSIFLGWTVVLLCVPFLIFVYQIYLAVQAYNGKTVEIPVITNLVKSQGWA